MEVSINGGTPKSSILVGFSTINQPVWGIPIYGKPQMDLRASQFGCQVEGEERAHQNLVLADTLSPPASQIRGVPSINWDHLREQTFENEPV